MLKSRFRMLASVILFVTCWAVTAVSQTHYARCYDLGWDNPGTHCGLCSGNDCHPVDHYLGRICGYSHVYANCCTDLGNKAWPDRVGAGICSKETGTCYCYVSSWSSASTTTSSPNCK